MKSRFTWDEQKRVKNLHKHHLDFADAGLVLDSQFRLDAESVSCTASEEEREVYHERLENDYTA